MTTSKNKLITRDKYAKARGGSSRLLEMHCTCGKQLLSYQKDGIGKLKRLYFDRIRTPKELTDLQTKDFAAVPPLKCACGNLIGVPDIYDKENRTAFRLVPGSFSKKIQKELRN